MNPSRPTCRNGGKVRDHNPRPRHDDESLDPPTAASVPVRLVRPARRITVPTSAVGGKRNGEPAVSYHRGYSAAIRAGQRARAEQPHQRSRDLKDDRKTICQARTPVKYWRNWSAAA